MLLQKIFKNTLRISFSGNNIIWYAFYSKFVAFTVFEKCQVLFLKKLNFFKNPILHEFEKYYFFNNFSRQICYNLAINIFRSEPSWHRSFSFDKPAECCMKFLYVALMCACEYFAKPRKMRFLAQMYFKSFHCYIERLFRVWRQLRYFKITSLCIISITTIPL